MLDDHGTKVSGNSFLRYHVIDMPDRMDVEVAFPVDELPVTESSVSYGRLPAGTVRPIDLHGRRKWVPANARLIDWIGDQGKEMDCRHSEDGDAFAGRIETLLTDPQAEPDQSKWNTQVAIPEWLRLVC
jgi:hypothetical protein